MSPRPEKISKSLTNHNLDTVALGISQNLTKSVLPANTKNIFNISTQTEEIETTVNLNKGFLFSIWVFCHDHSRITGLQGKAERISLTPHYHFHPLHGHLDISRAITAESSPLYIGSSRTRTWNL